MKTFARALPGIACIICAITGTLMLFGVGWSLLVAAVLFLLLDLRMPS